MALRIKTLLEFQTQLIIFYLDKHANNKSKGFLNATKCPNKLNF